MVTNVKIGFIPPSIRASVRFFAPPVLRAYASGPLHHADAAASLGIAVREPADPPTFIGRRSLSALAAFAIRSYTPLTGHSLRIVVNFSYSFKYKFTYSPPE
jgi:hypothetical protein